MEARFACGSMVRFFFFTKILHRVQNLCEKEENLPPCRRRYLLPMRDRLISLSSGRFADFVHFVVFVVQTPTA
jgi:hypothetical protein